ncbi:hypothetical protein QE152_g4757 [Popillia japonica]|uniref:Uncharacterized protein n=1 Tax=Popillia japonica TaxID=7064 RepID=A0AAW1MZK3_POPJA
MGLLEPSPIWPSPIWFYQRPPRMKCSNQPNLAQPDLVLSETSEDEMFEPLHGFPALIVFIRFRWFSSRSWMSKKYITDTEIENYWENYNSDDSVPPDPFETDDESSYNPSEGTLSESSEDDHISKKRKSIDDNGVKKIIIYSFL